MLLGETADKADWIIGVGPFTISMAGCSWEKAAPVRYRVPTQRLAQTADVAACAKATAAIAGEMFGAGGAEGGEGVVEDGRRDLSR